MEEIIVFLRNIILPSGEKEVEQLKRKANWFIWHDGHLYKKSYTQPLLKCVTPFEGSYILMEIHKGACSSHQGIQTIVGKAVRAEYYWPTLKQDASKLVKKCRSCQLHEDIPRIPANPLTTIQAVLPFDKWGMMDLLGPFPSAFGQRRFLIMAIDYFTKWVEEERLASITNKQVQKFIWRNMILVSKSRSSYGETSSLALECHGRLSSIMANNSIVHPLENIVRDSASKLDS